MTTSASAMPGATCNSTRECPVCGSRHASLLQHFDLIVPEGYLLDQQLDVLICRHCGMAFNDTSCSQADYDHYYADASKYDDSRTTTGGGLSGWDRMRLEQAARWIAERFPRDARIIDVGCATGGLLQCLQATGFTDLVGIDPSQKCVSITRESVGEAYIGSVFQLPPIPRGDLCILYAVLEHIRDVPQAISDCRNLLKEGGCLYVVVPDGARYAQYAPSPYQDFNTEHINHFSEATLDRVVKSVGFTTVACGPLDIPTNAGVSKAIEGLWRRTESPASEPVLFDPALETSLAEYREVSEQRVHEIQEALRVQVVPGEPHLVWGTGQLLYKLLGLPPLRDLKIVGFIDSNPVNQNKRLRGVPVLPPAAAAHRTEPIIVASILAFESIETQLRTELGMSNRLIRLTR